MFKFKFQHYINLEKKCSLQWIIVAFTVLCAVLLITPWSGIRRHNDTEFNLPKRRISDTSSIDRIPDDQTNKSVNYQRSTTISDDDQTSASIPGDQTSLSFIDDHISTTTPHDQTSTSFIDDNTSARIPHDQSSFDDQARTCKPANHTHVNTKPIPTYLSTPLIPAHTGHPDSQPFSYPRNRCLHQQNVDEREIGFVQYRNRINPLRPRLTPDTNVNSQEISNHPIRCLHLKTSTKGKWRM